MAKRTIARIVSGARHATNHDPEWTSEEWLGSLDLAGVLAGALLKSLRASTSDKRYERRGAVTVTVTVTTASRHRGYSTAPAPHPPPVGMSGISCRTLAAWSLPRGRPSCSG